MLRGFRLRHGQGNRADLAQVQRTRDGVRQQQPLALVRPGHRYTGAHAVIAGRRGLQGNQQGLRGTGRQGNARTQALTIRALDQHIQGQRPIHSVLHTQAHLSLLRPVPAAALRSQLHTRLCSGVKGHTAQHLALRRRFANAIRQVSILRGDLHNIHRPHKVEQLLRLFRHGCTDKARER